jgi:hypothetical protein
VVVELATYDAMAQHSPTESWSAVVGVGVARLRDSSTAVAAVMPAMWDKVRATIPALDRVELVGKLVVVGDGLSAVLAAVLVPAVVGEQAPVTSQWAMPAVWDRALTATSAVKAVTIQGEAQVVGVDTMVVDQEASTATMDQADRAVVDQDILLPA